MRKRGLSVLLSAVVVAQLAFSPISVQAATTLYDSKTGNEDGYDYELWKDRGTTSMTLTGNGTFECSWSNINNALFRTGKKFDSTKTYQQIGNISVDYGCNYQPNGNSYLCVYGWTVDPLVEYYVVDSWGTWRPPGSTPKGQITVDGGTYDVYETTRYNQPSIKGDTTFQQYWSVRTSKKTSGTISVSEHFKAWERMGMKCGKLYETALTVEGYQSAGTAKVYKNNITIGGSSNNNPVVNPTQTPSTQPDTGVVNTANTMQCEDMTLSGQYAGKTNSPFSGVALYANNDAASYTQQFGYDTHDFTLRGASNNNNTAAVDLKIGGEKKGTFYFKGTTPTDVTLKNIKHATGNVKIELTVSTDDNTWDAYIDSLKIGSAAAPTQAPTAAPTVAPTQAPQQSVTGNIADGWYYIKGVGSQKYLQVQNSSAQANANVVIANGNGNAGQVWKVTNTNDGYITLTSKLGNFMLDVANGSSEDGANIGIYNAYSGDAQKFVAKEVGNGIYTINTKSSSSQKVLDVEGRKTADGTNVCQYRATGNTNQQWQFELVAGQTEQPTVAPTQAPTVVPTQAPQQPTGGVSCTYKTTGDWGSGFQGEIVIKNNTSSAVNGWTATFTTNGKINSLWGATLVGQSGSTVTVKNCDWDTTLAPNASVSIGFVADGNPANCAPTNFKFNGTAVNGGQTQQPTQAPTVAPTQAPTVAPTQAPTVAPTQAPTVAPSQPVNVTIETYCPSNMQQKIAGVQYGTLQKKSYYSTTCAKMRNVNVLLPAGYTTSKKYPVLYVLHGIFGDENSMVGNCDTLIGNMIAKGLAKDMIVVFPYMFASRTQDQCTGFDDANFAAYDNFVNDLADDLMPWMAKNYSIATGKANTAITGFSMGGRESLAIGIQRSDLFGYVGAVAPAPGLVATVDGFAVHKGMFQESQMKFSKGDPYLVMVCSGDKDSVVGTNPMEYHNIFVKNNVKHTWWIVPGSDHGDPAISSNIYNFAKYIFK